MSRLDALIGSYLYYSILGSSGLSAFIYYTPDSAQAIPLLYY